MINAIIVDDEPYCCEVLNTLLQKYCPEVSVISICSSVTDALSVIREQTPKLVFLDVEMPVMNGFEMLEQLSVIDFHLIFTTSYDQYALKAFRFSALDYLLKPIDREELQVAVQKVLKQAAVPTTQQLDLLIQKARQPLIPMHKVALPSLEGLHLIAVDSILMCESDSNYTIIYLKSKHKIVVSRTLKEIEELLEDYSFVRVHHSYLVNLNEIEKYVKGEGGYLILSDGTTVDVSRTRKESVLKKLLHNRH